MPRKDLVEGSVPVKLDIPVRRIQDLICSALEGGSNYWYTITEFNEPDEFPNRFDLNRVFKHVEYPTNPGGSLVIRDKEDDSRPDLVLNLDSIARGINVMAEKHPRHFAVFLSENDDAETGDVFLQCCLFGELVYG